MLKSARHPVEPGTLPVSKRSLGLGLAALILLGALLLPLSTKLSANFEKWQAGLPWQPTAMLSPGPLASGHRAFEMQCSTCHRQAFVRVPDAACTECHARMLAHLPNDPAALSPQASCIGCHAGHAGKANSLQGGLPQCVECHQGATAEVGKAHDFADSHPEFRLAVIQGKGQQRLKQEASLLLHEAPGIKFSHKAHLVKGGVSTPLGNTVLECRDCHRLEESGQHFAPMEMEKTCQQSRCHKQRFAEPLVGLIPHGSELAVMGKLRSLYADRLVTAPAAMARECGQSEQKLRNTEFALSCIEDRTRSFAAAKLFQEEGKALQCGLCHELMQSDDKAAPWQVAPVRIQRDWHAKATFSHARHDTIGCADCHDKAESKSSADVAMPGIAKCRECHAGSRASATQIRSRCESCHKYHRAPTAER
jgi:hypothetical protein